VTLFNEFETVVVGVGLGLALSVYERSLLILFFYKLVPRASPRG